MKTKRSISKTFMIIMIVMAYFPVVILGGIAIQKQYSAFDKESRQLKEEYIEAQEIIVKHEVEKAMKDIQYRRQNTRLPEKKLKKKILKWLSEIRFPNRGNEPGILFVRSYKGIRLMSVSTPELIGKDTSKITDPNGINTHEQFMKTIKNPGGGYVEYSWYNPVVKKVTPKRTFIKGIPDWEWYIGAGFWFDDINSVIEQKRLELKSTVKNYVVAIVLTMLILFMFTYMILRYLSGKIEESFDGFSSFFKEAATQSAEIDLKKLHFSEFEDLASSANKMISDRKKAEEKIKHLNRVLSAIRNVNQLVVTEKNRDRLIQGACDSLTETRGYYNAWIVLLNKSGKYVMSAESRLGKDFLPMIELLKKDELTLCGEKALSQTGVVVTEDPASTCADCPLSEKHAGRNAMTIRLEHGGKIYGLLSVSIPEEFALSEEEQGLFKEVAGDIAFALYGMELEENRKHAEEQIRKSLREKETLLAEIHHRVKNNMQIVTSLLSLQSKDIKDERALSLIKNCEDRIKAMSLVHEKLYLSKDLSRIDFHNYMEDLSARLFQAHRVDSRVVSFSSHIKDVSFNIETAIPLGLIINEIISNAIKHAFPEGRKGNIAVELTQNRKAEEYTLTVTDDGIGFPEEIDYRNTETFGLQLVDMLTEQLGGTIKLDRSKGTAFKIVFKERKYKKRI